MTEDGRWRTNEDRREIKKTPKERWKKSDEGRWGTGEDRRKEVGENGRRKKKTEQQD